jgi:predicted DNA-binding transcriptional regulator AlpA
MYKEFSPRVSSASELTPPHDADLALAIQKLLAALQAIVVPTTFEIEPRRRRAARAKEAIQIVGLGRSSFFARQNVKDAAWDSTFPRSFKLGSSPRSPTVWFVDELEAWLASRAASRDHSQEGRS